jgi:DNA-binding Lrp family transcriptional regulator
VNHNYRREHEFNMWFVVTAASVDRRDAIVDAIETETGLTALRLPMRTSYYIDLEFPVVNADRLAGESEAARASSSERVTPTPVASTPIADLSAFEAKLLVAVQSGLPVSATPYADVAAELGTTEDAVVEGLTGLLARGCVKRIGCIVDHRRTGFDANCMVVWDVPDAERDDRGAVVGGFPYVTLCYHRPPRPEQGWPYSLFTMVHGRDRDRVDATIDDLANGPLPYEHARLYSTETLKQTGARYEALLDERPIAADD